MTIEKLLLPPKSLNRPGTKLKDSKIIVLHYVGNPMSTPEQNILFWKNRKDYGSAHAVIGLDGRIVQAIPFDEVAYHAGTSGPTKYKNTNGELYLPDNANNYSIGIELCHTAWESGYTEETTNSLKSLLKDLSSEFSYVATHFDITGKLCDYYFMTHHDELVELANDCQLNTLVSR